MQSQLLRIPITKLILEHVLYLGTEHIHAELLV